MRKFKRILLISAFMLLASGLTVLAADDAVAPVFDSNIQTMYLLQRKDDGTKFIPENYITGIKATDDVDGNDVTVVLEHNNVDLSQDGQYQLLYTATDKSGNSSSLIIIVVVDGTGPTFDENEETTYYINKEGIIFDSNNNVVESLPETLTAKDSMGAYKGIGVYITSDENGNIIFLDTIDNTPAVGLLLPNDKLIGIDSEDVHGKTPDYAATKIKNEDSDSVDLTIVRNDKKMTITVPKDIIKLYPEESYIATPNIQISSINKEEWEKQLDLFLNDKAVYQERTMIKADLYRKDKIIAKSYALNDVVISAKNTARTVALDVSYNSYHLCKLKSDGVIVSTATGSTAYSASAGGPIVEPSLNAFVFTPINSFSLSSRPIVLNGEGKIEIVIQPCRTKEICMIVDGQEPVTLQTNDKIIITTIEKKIKLICSTKDNFYNALRSKMNWSGGPHA